MVNKDKIREIVDYTISEYYGLTHKCSIIKSSPYYSNAIRLSEKYGLKIKRCTRTELRFEDLNHKNPLNDKITSTELRFDGMLDSDKINLFDDNHNKGKYTLDEVLGFYTSMPTGLKNGTGLIVFDDSSNQNYSIIYDPNLRRENVVHMTSYAYKDNPNFNFERIMAHEMGHCLEMGQLTSSEKSVVRKLANGELLDYKENRIFIDGVLPKIHTYSRRGGVFAEAVDMDSDVGGLPVEYMIRSAYARNYYAQNWDDDNCSLGEHFAETVSVVSFRDKEDKINAILDCGDDTTLLNLTYNEYVYEGGQVESIPVVEDLLFGESKIRNIEYVDYG